MAQLDPAEVPILFVCGLHRSGTTALARLLGTAPGVRSMSGTGVFADEGQHLQQVFPPASRYGGPGAFALDSRSWLTERSELATGTNARAVLAAWAPFWRLAHDECLGWGTQPGRVVLVEKSPPNLVRTRFLQALFPQARFLILRRHPGVVAMSTHQMCPQREVPGILRNWVVAHDRLEADAHVLHVVHEVRYEDLVADPAAACARLAAALEIDAGFDVSSLEAGRSQTHLQAWQSELPTLPTALRERLEERVHAYGYSLEAPYVWPH